MLHSALLLIGVIDALDRHVDALPARELLTQPIATLVDAQRQAAGARLASLELPGWFAGIAAQAIVLFWFWRSGNAARWRDTLRRHLGGEWGARFVFGATLALVARVAEVLFAFYLWRVDRVMGLSHALTRVWLYEYVLGTIITMIVAGLVAAIILGLVDRTHQWYLYAIAGIIAVSLLGTLADPYVIAPLFERYTPLRGSLAAEADKFAHDHGYHVLHVVVEHRLDRIPVDPAKTQGMGVTQRVVFADTMIAAASRGEIDFYVADELAQLNEREPLDLALVDAAIVIVGIALAVVVADRVPFRRDDDPVSRLALVGALLAVVYVFAIPIDHAEVAAMQLRADRAAVTITGDRASAMRALVRAGDERIEQVCPQTLGRLFLSRKPSLGQRAGALGSTSGCP